MKLQGFIDSHLHVLGIGYYDSLIDLSAMESIEEIVSFLKEYKDRSILIGKGWNQSQFKEGRMIQREDLNQISTDIPIVLRRVCGHVLVVNDRMLEIAGINKNTKQISGGTFNLDTGIFTEKALNLIYQKMPKPSKKDLRNYFIKADEILIKHGITQVASDDFSSFDIDFRMVIDVLKELYEEGLMHVKITEQVNLSLEDLKAFIDEGYVNKYIHPKFRMGPLKILADGSLGGRTAAMIEPYHDDIHEMGILTYTDDELFEKIHLANQQQMDSVIHTIGDAASLQAIKALTKSIKATKRFKHAHALIHAQLTPKNQIDMMKAYDIGAIVQPIFINSDMNILEERIGERMNHTYLFHSMYNNLRLGFSTDAPIEPVSPFLNIYTAMTYKSIKHANMPCLNPSQKFTFEEAIKAYTINNLPFVYETSLNQDDYIEIDGSIDDNHVEKLKKVTVLKTVIDGKVVYSKNS